MTTHPRFGPAAGAALHPAPPAPVRLHGLGTAMAPHTLPQDLVLERARALLGPRFPQFERLAPAFENAGVARRGSVVPIEWFEEAHAWQDRNDAYLEGATAMYVEAASAALDAAGWQAEEVDIAVTVSSTGVATPTLEARAAGALGFRPDLQRVPLFGLGCAGGVTGLSVAQRLASVRPGAKALMVAVEACTLSFRMDRLRKADIIATVLFGDGAGAACLSAGDGVGAAGAFGAGHEHRWPDTLQIMGWDVDDTGLGVVFDRSIPEFAATEVRASAEAALASAGLSHGEIDRWVCHPGGAKVVGALERALDLPAGSLDAEREVLRGAGNMSAPTVVFVLDRVLRAGVRGQLMLMAMGPGFTASFLPLDLRAGAA